MEILKRYIISFVTLVTLSGCMKDFEPETDQPSVLCLNAMITAGEPFELSVTHTWRYSKPVADPTVGDADVALYVNDEFVERLVYDESRPEDGSAPKSSYKSAYAPASGDRLKIVAESERYGAATAEVTVPAPPTVRDVKAEPAVTSTWFSDHGDGSYAIDLSFRLSIIIDIADVDKSANYFVFDWANGSDEEETGFRFSLGSLNYDAEPVFSEHISAFESIMGSDAWGFSVFSDRRFAGKSYPLKAVYNNCSFYLWTGYDPVEDYFHPTVEVSVDNISKSYYDWLIYDWQVDNGFIGSLGDIGFADAIISCSNVSTGAGVVAARARTARSVDLHDFIMDTLNNLQNNQQ